MKIVHINADSGIPPAGTKGASIHRRELIRGLRERGHTVIPTSAKPGEGTLPLGDYIDLVSAVRSSGSPDVVYERYSIGHLEGLRAAETLGVPFILEVNSPLLIEAERHRGYVPALGDVTAEMELFRGATVVRVVSGWLRSYVADRRGHDRRVHVIGNGHDPTAYPHMPSFEGRPTIVFLGHPKPWHGADRLVGLLGEIRRRGTDARLIVVGSGSGAQRVRVAAAASGIAGHLHITGPLDSSGVAHQLAHGWVGVAPYPLIDDFYFSPLKVMDYLGAGLPVVASHLGDIPSIVGNGGVTVDPDSLEQLADAVEGLLVDPLAAAAIGKLGRERARREQTWAGVCEAIENSITALPLGVAS